MREPLDHGANMFHAIGAAAFGPLPATMPFPAGVPDASVKLSAPAQYEQPVPPQLQTSGQERPVRAPLLNHT